RGRQHRLHVTGPPVLPARARGLCRRLEHGTRSGGRSGGPRRGGRLGPGTGLPANRRAVRATAVLAEGSERPVGERSAAIVGAQSPSQSSSPLKRRSRGTVRLAVPTHTGWGTIGRSLASSVRSAGDRRDVGDVEVPGEE